MKMLNAPPCRPRVRRNGEFYVCFKSNGRPFWFGNYSTCKRKAGKIGFVREVKDHE